MMKVNQLELPFGNMPEYEHKARSTKGGGESAWYFVERRDPPYQTLYADEQGRYYYGERDLIRCVPVLFNTRSEASRVAHNQRGVARKYPYAVE